ncbi:hypothetical protein L1049_002051 [Liquidambar formosana]|uniref:Uncharacterized protein n=1 Tax=Liquidambar formosana TaxID=63359 RepID=A0AAP0NF97_LIQFO
MELRFPDNTLSSGDRALTISDPVAYAPENDGSDNGDGGVFIFEVNSPARFASVAMAAATGRRPHASDLELADLAAKFDGG